MFYYMALSNGIYSFDVFAGTGKLGCMGRQRLILLGTYLLLRYVNANDLTPLYCLWLAFCFKSCIYTQIPSCVWNAWKGVESERKYVWSFSSCHAHYKDEKRKTLSIKLLCPSQIQMARPVLFAFTLITTL